MKILFHKKNWSTVLLLLAVVLGFGQEEKHSFKQLSVENGLSNNSVNCILKDSRGFLWVGTTDGLNRYNGYSFKVFKHDPSDENSISDNFISTIVEDHSGNLWIGTQGGGLNKYDYQRDVFMVFKHDPSDESSIISNFIFHHRSILLDGDSILWIGTDNGLCKLNINRETFKRCRLKVSSFRGVEVKDVRVIFEETSDALWLGTDIGLVQYDKESGRTKLYENLAGEPHSISNSIITSIASGKDNNHLWIGTEEGLNLFDKKSGLSTRYFNEANNPVSLSDNSITSIITDKSGNFWIGTKSGGLNMFDPAKGEFRHWKQDPMIQDAITDNYIDYLYYCDDDLLWIGTVNAGINILDIKKKGFELIQRDPKNPNSLSYNTIRFVYKDRKGILWIGTYGGGLNYYDGENFKHYLHKPDDTTSISHNIVSVILEDSHDNFWVGTWGGGLNRMNRSSQTFEQRVLDVPEFVNDLYEDAYGNIWIGCNGGLYIYKSNNRRLIRLDSDTDPNRKLTATSINKIYQDSYGNYWISTWEGLNQIIMKDGELNPEKIYHFTKDQHNIHNLSDNRIITIFEDSRKNLWLGTYAGGLNQINLEQLYRAPNQPAIFLFYTEENGLPGNTIYGILEDEHGFLWMSTNNGLSKFDPEKKVFYNFTVDDGLQGNQFYWRAYLKDRSGKMYFGGTNGLNAFYPDSIKTEYDFPSVAITDFLLFNKSVKAGETINGRRILGKSILFTDHIELTRKDYAFSFEFTALTFQAQDKIRFAYKLENFDPDWIITDSKRRYATYSHLRPGNYIFKVKSTSRSGQLNDKYTQVGITVLPAYYETVWAFIIYGILLVLLLWFLRSQILARAHYKHNIQLERIEREQAEEYNDMKLRFFTNISHEFRTPLTLILGPLEKLNSMELLDKKARQQLTFMKIGGKRLLRLINQILKFRKVETGNFELIVTKKDIIPFIREVAISFKSQSMRSRIRYTLKIPVRSAYVWFDENIIETIVYNLLSNAFKFTPEKGNIQLILEFLDDNNKIITSDTEQARQIRIKISDTGSGIPKDRLENIFKRFYQIGKTEEQKRGTGLGLALCKDLVELHRGTLEVESGENKGTIFTVTIPIHEQFFKQEEIILQPGELEEVQQVHEFLKEETEILFSDVEFDSIKFGEPRSDNVPKILIIEDDHELVKYLGKLLEEKYHLLAAYNGKKGIELAANEEPDLIISDVMLPDKNGFELCEAIKTNILISHIPIILLTALSSFDDKMKGLSTGADDYISKPFHPQHLLIRIEKLIEQRRKLRQHFQQKFSLNKDYSEIPTVDEEFLKKVTEFIESNMAETNLNVEEISEQIGISSTHLYRKIKSLTGLSTNELIRKIRLKKAAGLLLAKQGSIAQVMYGVGFSSQSYFAKCFQEEFGLSPKEYIAANKKMNK